ncbi:MAG: hypothetical protein Kow00121_54360 [Elainellaceae cyanobacterium]
MYQSFDSAAIDDLFYDAAEGPSRMRHHYADAFDEFDDTLDEFDMMSDYGDAYDTYSEADLFDVMEDAMADALGAEDTEEFVRRFRRAVNIARRIGRGVGRVARVVAPIASAIPHPAAQAVGRAASTAGRLLADGADEFEALDELIEVAEAEDLMDAAAPVMAGLAIHGTLPQVTRLPHTARRQLVHTTTQTAQALARQQGTQAVRALPAAIQTAQRVARRQGLPPSALPQVMRRVGMRLSRNPRLVRRLLSSLSPAMRASICSACGRQHRRPAMR